MDKREVAKRRLVRNAANSALGNVSLAGMLENLAGPAKPSMRVLGSYGIAYMLDGEGSYEDTNGLKMVLRPGDMVLAFPKIGHNYGPQTGQVWTEFFFVFNGPVFELWEHVGLLDPARPVHHLEPITYWLEKFESVVGAARQPGLAPPLLEVCRLQQVLGEALVGGPHGPAGQEAVRWASRACVLLESDLTHSLDMPRVARQMGMNYESFRKVFARIMGVPPNRYRANRIAERACELMQQGSLTDKQIARRLGFCDEFHFSRRFKEIVGVPPRVFRRQLLRIS